eukprot:scaffold71149_cov20-Tisochrysis_lutea.AAC.2
MPFGEETPPAISHTYSHSAYTSGHKVSLACPFAAEGMLLLRHCVHQCAILRQKSTQQACRAQGTSDNDSHNSCALRCKGLAVPSAATCSVASINTFASKSRNDEDVQDRACSPQPSIHPSPGRFTLVHTLCHVRLDGRVWLKLQGR